METKPLDENLQNADKTATQKISERKEVMLFLLIPISVIALLAAILWLPSVLTRTKYDFIYSSCPSYDCSFDYEVKDGHITPNYYVPYRLDLSSANRQIPRLYYYNVTNDSYQQIDEIKAQSYTLNSSNISPDGYRLEKANDSSGGGFLFWGSSSDTNWYLKDGLKKKKVQLLSDNYYQDVTFLGWVEK